jgi:hypothetical protein
VKTDIFSVNLSKHHEDCGFHELTKGEGWERIEKNQRFTNFLIRSAKNAMNFWASVLPREIEFDCEEWITEHNRS